VDDYVDFYISQQRLEPQLKMMGFMLVALCIHPATEPGNPSFVDTVSLMFDLLRRFSLGKQICMIAFLTISFWLFFKPLFRFVLNNATFEFFMFRSSMTLLLAHEMQYITYRVYTCRFSNHVPNRKI